MALQVWLPLIEDVHNQGLYPLEFTNNNAQVTTGGCLGSCYTFTATTGTGIYCSTPAYQNFLTECIDNHSFSMCCFFKTTETSRATPPMHITYGVRLFVGTANTFSLYNSSRTVAVSDSTSTADGKWHHICGTYDADSGAMRLYIDGLLKASNTYTAGAKYVHSWTNPFYIGRNPNDSQANASYFYQGSVQDARFYDHCLSAKEVEEIAKCLAVHYKMDESYGMTNILEGQNLSVYNNYGTGCSYTAVDIGETFMGQRVRRWTYTPMTESVANGFKSGYGSRGVYTSWIYIDALSGTLSSVYWIYYRPHTSGLTAGGTASNIGGWTEIPREYLGNGWWRVGQYRTKNNHASRTTDAIFTSLNWPYAAVGSSCTIDFTDSGYYVSGTTSIPDKFVNGSSIVHDCSGYGRDGTITGNLFADTGSPRYSTGVRFGGHNCYFLAKNPFYNNVMPITISFWFKPSASNNSYNTIISNTYPHGGFWISCNSESQGCWSYNSSLYIHGRSGLLTNGRWYHMVWQYKGNNQYQWFLDGVPIETYTSGTLKPPTFTEYISVGGCQCADTATSSSRYDQYGSISDIKIFGKVLSDAEVAELYHTSASIDNRGNVFCGEFKEL